MKHVTCSLVAVVGLALPALADDRVEVDIETDVDADYRRTDALKWAAAGFGAIHLADHVLRNNHNGWPFSPEVTPATAAYIAVPSIFGAGLYFDGPLYWVIADSVLLAGVGLTHVFVEPPSDVYEPWTNESNLLEADSKTTGIAAVVIVGGVVTTLGAHLVSTIMDGREHGWTWKRQSRRERKRAVTVMPVVGGGGVSAGWTF